ncbi:MAG: hypothetical protein M3163_08400 [Actinomycetota bacterium]|nr:hypothetical protein [Actinomycetota bacterium]
MLPLLLVAVPIAVLANQAAGAGLLTGFLEVCKEADGPAVTGDFTFEVAGHTVVVPVGACSGPVELPAGPVTIREVAVEGLTLTAVHALPAHRLLAQDLGAATARVTVVAGDVSAQTAVTFTNRAEFAPLKVCKVGGTGIAVGTEFNFVAGGERLSVPAGPAPGGYCVIVGSFPVGADVAVSEQAPRGTQVSAIEIAPKSRLVGTPNLPGGAVVVRIGAGFTEATFTNQAVQPAVTTTTTVPPNTVSPSTTTTVPPSTTTTVPPSTTTTGSPNTTTTAPPSTTTTVPPTTTTTAPSSTTTTVPPSTTTTVRPGTNNSPVAQSTTTAVPPSTTAVPPSTTTTVLANPTTTVPPNTSSPVAPTTTTTVPPSTATTNPPASTTTTLASAVTATTLQPSEGAPTSLPLVPAAVVPVTPLPPSPSTLAPPGAPTATPPAVPSRELALTGASLLHQLVLAGLVIAAGGLLVRLSSRRRRSPSQLPYDDDFPALTFAFPSEPGVDLDDWDMPFEFRSAGVRPHSASVPVPALGVRRRDRPAPELVVTVLDPPQLVTQLPGP